jgi:hypothetical protein
MPIMPSQIGYYSSFWIEGDPRLASGLLRGPALLVAKTQERIGRRSREHNGHVLNEACCGRIYTHDTLKSGTKLIANA